MIDRRDRLSYEESRAVEVEVLPAQPAQFGTAGCRAGAACRCVFVVHCAMIRVRGGVL